MNHIGTDYNKVWYTRTDGRNVCIDCVFHGYPTGNFYSKCILRKDKKSTTVGVNCCDSYKFKGKIKC